MRKIYSGWRVPVAAAFGISCGVTVLSAVSFGYFVKPLHSAFGWTESEIAIALTLHSGTLVCTLPWVGRLVDRFGTRNVVLPSTILYGLVLASLSFLTPLKIHLYASYIALAVLGSGASPITYARAITLWFDRRRGMALGLALTGSGVGLAAIPVYTQFLIATFGWRNAYLGLGGLLIFIVAPIIALLLRDAPKNKTEMAVEKREMDYDQSDLSSGFSVRESIKGWRFWVMAGSFLFLGTAIGAMHGYLAPIMAQHGLSAAEAAKVSVALGLSTILGRLLGGYLMDRIYAPIVGAVAGMAAVAAILILQGLTEYGYTALLIGGLYGLASGTEGDLLSYLTGRYFGRKNFAELYGWLAAAHMFGMMIAPLALARSAELLGSYNVALLGSAAALAVGSFVLLSLGRYPRFS
jgi:MFS family permease